MTPVIIATQVDDYVYLYYRDSDGGLTQTGQVLVGPAQPVELARIAAELSDHLAWSKVVRARQVEPVEQSEPKPESKAAIEKKTRRAHGPDRLKRTKAEIAAFDEKVWTFVGLRDHTTIPEIAEGLLFGLGKQAQNSVRSSLDRLSQRGLVTRDRDVGHNESHRYSVVQDAGTGSPAPVESSSLGE